MVQRRLREHVLDPTRLPLLIFPEGTCVNNEYCVMFKRGRNFQILPARSSNAF
jgi:glycerol-3-phosphate O-acyltransferase 3/4